MTVLRKMLSVRSVVILLGLALAALGQSAIQNSSEKRVVAYFENANGIYAGDEVRVLGVIVGKIKEIEPLSDRVRVTMAVDADVQIPAEAKAALVAPSLVSSRFVQLSPQYTGGPRLRDGDEIPLERTAVPVEWDEIKGQLNDLAVALGPNGANEHGSLNHLIRSGAGALRGQGAPINESLDHLARAVRVLDRGGDDMFATVRNLQVFVSALAESDQQIVRINNRLGIVSDVLADNRHDLRTGIVHLQRAVKAVDRLVRENGTGLQRTVKNAGDVSRILVAAQDDLAQLLHAAPHAIDNLYAAYHRDQNAVGIGLQMANLMSPAQLACGAIAGATQLDGAQLTRTCRRLLAPLIELTGGPDDEDGPLQPLDDLLEGLL